MYNFVDWSELLKKCILRAYRRANVVFYPAKMPQSKFKNEMIPRRKFYHRQQHK